MNMLKFYFGKYEVIEIVVFVGYLMNIILFFFEFIYEG